MKEVDHIRKKLERVPPGSTIILSTTSPDKKEEYARIFRHYDVNFFTLEDFGLSPQKTDEMTGTYNNNLMQKAVELSQTLYHYRKEIRSVLQKQGINGEQSKIIGMVEDSGMEVYPNDKHLREAFARELHHRLEEKIYGCYDNKDSAEHADLFEGLTLRETIDRLYSMWQDTDWLFNIEDGDSFPGPNLKPVMEHLHGGFREFVDTIYESMEAAMLEDIHRHGAEMEQELAMVQEKVAQERTICFRNKCTAMFVEADPNPKEHLHDSEIISGNNTGQLLSRSEFEALLRQKFSGEVHRRANDKADMFYLSSVVVPDGQRLSDKTREDLLHEGGYFSRSREERRADDYRLDMMDRLAEKYAMKRITRSELSKKWENPHPLKVAFLYVDEQNGTEHEQLHFLEERLAMEPGIEIVSVPTKQEMLEDPNQCAMDGADLVFQIPGHGTDLDNARALLAVTTDKQTRPGNKENTLAVINPNGRFDNALAMLRMNNLKGLKNGQPELDSVLDCGDSRHFSDKERDELYDRVQYIAAEAQLKKQAKLTGDSNCLLDPLQVKALEPLPQDEFTVFVAGGAANDAPLFKEPSNRLGRYLHDQEWVLVSGAGQKDGPMGAVHSGFVEAWLRHQLQDPKKKEIIETTVNHYISNHVRRKDLTGKYANDYRDSIYNAAIDAPDAAMLGVHAKGLLNELLNPEPGSEIYGRIGSLEEEGRMWGYSMEYLLASEGSGKPPPGAYYQEAGNMQRRMHEMTQAAAHVYMAGGQGTIQELMESVVAQVARQERGEPVQDVIVFNQESYNGGQVYEQVLTSIDIYLKHHGLTREEVGLHEVHSSEALEAELRQSCLRWQKIREQGGRTDPDSCVGIPESRSVKY